MHFEYINALEITYGNALVVHGDYHRITNPEGKPVEISPGTYLWSKCTYYIDSHSEKGAINSCNTAQFADGITALYLGSSLEVPPETNSQSAYWIKLEKAIDPINDRYLWYRRHTIQQIRKWREELLNEEAGLEETLKLLPIREIHILHDLKHLASAQHEYIPVYHGPKSGVASNDSTESVEIMKTSLGFERMTLSDFSLHKWTLHSQDVGSWIDFCDRSTAKWHVAQIVHKSGNHVRVLMSSWNEKQVREDVISLASLSGKVSLSRSKAQLQADKLGTNTIIQLAPSYPMMLKQGMPLDMKIDRKVIQQIQTELDTQFFCNFERQLQNSDAWHELFESMESLDLQVIAASSVYLSQRLIPFLENFLLSAYVNEDLTLYVHNLHIKVIEMSTPLMLSYSEYILKHPIAPSAGSETAETLTKTLRYRVNMQNIQQSLLCCIRMILNGFPICAFFYARYPSRYASDALAPPKYIVSPQSDSRSSQSPVHSSYFVRVLDVFIQKGGLKMLTQRLHAASLDEVAIFAYIVRHVKPCVPTTQSFRASAEYAVLLSRLQSFLYAALLRLAQLSALEIRDEMEVVYMILEQFQAMYGDDMLLQGNGNCTAESLLEKIHQYDANKSLLGHYIHSGKTDLGYHALCELLEMDIAKQMICCPFLQQRLVGLGQLMDILRQKVDLSETTRSANQNTSNINVIVGEWLVHSHILEVILGDTTHCKRYNVREGSGTLQIVKRSKPLFQAVADLRLLSDSHIVLLWKLAASQLRSDRKLLLEMLISIVERSKSADLLDIVAVLLTQVPVSDYDELLLHLLHQVVLLAARHSMEAESGMNNANTKHSVYISKRDIDTANKVVSLGVSLLWSIVTDDKWRSKTAEYDAFDEEIPGSEVLAQSQTKCALLLTYLYKVWRSAAALAAVLGPNCAVSTLISSNSAKEQQQLLSKYLAICVEHIERGDEDITCLSFLYRVLHLFSRSLEIEKAFFTPNQVENTSESVANVRNRLENEVSRAIRPAEQLFSMYQLLESRVSDQKVEPALELRIVSACYQAVERYTQRWPAGNVGSSIALQAFRARLWYLGFFLWKFSPKKQLLEPLQRIWQLLQNLDQSARNDAENLLLFWLCYMFPLPQSTMIAESPLGDGATHTYFTQWVDALTCVGSSKLPWLSCKALPNGGFWLYTRLFQLTHLKEKRIQLLPLSGENEMNAKHFIIETLDLHGLEAFYRMVTDAIDDRTSSLASKYLIYLHTHLNPKLSRRDVWESLLTHTMELLKKPISELFNGQTDAKGPINCLLRLLITFLYNSVHTFSQNDRKEALHRVRVHIVTQDGRSGAPIRYYVRKSALVSDFRDQIAYDCNFPADRVRLVNDRAMTLKVQNHDKVTLDAACVFAEDEELESNMRAILLIKPEPDTAGHVIRNEIGNTNFVQCHWTPHTNTTSSKAKMKILRFNAEKDLFYAKKIISGSETYMSMLYSLLVAEEHVQIAQKAFVLLQLFAPDVDMYKRIQTLDDCLGFDGHMQSFPHTFDWQSLLDLSCTPKMLYQILFVEHFAMISDCMYEKEQKVPITESKALNSALEEALRCKLIDSECKSECNLWSESFVRLGGMRHLSQFLAALDIEKLLANGRPLALTCFAKCIKLFGHFMGVRSHSEREGSDGKEKRGRNKAILDRVTEFFERQKDEFLVEEQTLVSEALPVASDEFICEEQALLAFQEPRFCDILDCEFLHIFVFQEIAMFYSRYLLATNDSSHLWLESLHDISERMLMIFIQSPMQPIRRIVARFILSLAIAYKADEAAAAQSACAFYLNWFSEYKGSVYYPEFYHIYRILLLAAVEVESFAFVPASQSLIHRLEALQSHEYEDEQDFDALMSSLLRIFMTLCQRIPCIMAGRWDIPYRARSLREVVCATLIVEENAIEILFGQCLFIEGASSSEKTGTSIAKPTCRSAETRQLAFELLSELCQENLDGMQRILTLWNCQHSLSTGKEHKMSEYRDPKNSKGPKPEIASAKMQSCSKTLDRVRYAGLKNLGCTCYLNSILQAFFMIVPFREAVLHLPMEQSHGNSTDNRLMSEMQSLFAHLQYTAKPSYSPKSFIDALKSWDGQAVDVMEQQDASEFLTCLLSQMEAEMNSASHSVAGALPKAGDCNLLDRYFGGIFSNELEAEGNRYSERLEAFHLISVPVRDQKTLPRALQSLFEGDIVSYTWDDKDCEDEKRITLDTVKRLSICELPEILIIHLKRFEYDLERGQRVKLHDRLEFPTKLDMFPFTKQGQRTQDKIKAREEYELMGTIVHMGTAHSGHYYSLLSEKGKDSTEQWYEFNDTIVSPFDSARLAEECFGGDDNAQSRLQMMKKRSSFMLFYARTHSLATGATDESRYSRKNLKAYALQIVFCIRLRRLAKLRTHAIRRHTKQVSVLAPLLQQIEDENRIFWRKRYFHDKTYLEFAFRLFRNCLMDKVNCVPVTEASLQTLSVQSIRFEPMEVRCIALQAATKYVFGTLNMSNDIGQMTRWRPILQALYYEEAEGCQWLLKLLSEDKALLRSLLTTHPKSQVRELILIALKEAIVTCSQQLSIENLKEKSSVEIGVERFEKHSKRTKEENAIAILPLSFEFIDVLLQQMPWLLTVPAIQHREYFALLLHFISAGRNECMFVMVNHGIGAIVSLLTGYSHAHGLFASEYKQSKPKQILKSLQLDATVLKLLSMLLRCCAPPAMDTPPSTRILPPNLIQDPMELSSADGDILVHTERWVVLLIHRARQHTRETKPLEQIVMQLCWESSQVTAMFMDRIMTGIETQDDADLKPYFRTLNTIFKIRDSLVMERIQDGMTKLLAVMASQQRYLRATEISIEMLTRIAKRHSRVVRWIHDNRVSCLWMQKWLCDHRRPSELLQQRRTVLVKHNSTSPYSSVSTTNNGFLKCIERSLSRLLIRLDSLLDPNRGMEYFYDSDDNPERLVGKRVRVKWAKEKWYDGRVEKFNESKYEHFIVYDDGDKRSYRMADKTFCVIDNERTTRGKS